MRSKTAWLLIGAFLYFCFAPAAFALTRTESKKERQVRTAVAQLGTGEQTRIAVRLKNGSRLKGYIASSDDQTFTISDLSTRLARVVRYSDVAQMHAQNLTSGQKWAIGAAVFLALMILAAVSLRGR
jgi:small nuclear ribonucleoprotein (snRNP)-like protein